MVVREAWEETSIFTAQHAGAIQHSQVSLDTALKTTARCIQSLGGKPASIFYHRVMGERQASFFCLGATICWPSRTRRWVDTENLVDGCLSPVGKLLLAESQSRGAQEVWDWQRHARSPNRKSWENAGRVYPSDYSIRTETNNQISCQLI